MNVFKVRTLFLIVAFLAFYFSTGAIIEAQSVEEIIIAKERAVLDRWKNGDVFGFIEIAADEITYFDPGLEKRCTGKKEFHDHLAPANGTFSFPSYELIDPQVQLHGDIGILTFNFVGILEDGKKNGWNATEVYRNINGDWRLISSHWSHLLDTRF